MALLFEFIDTLVVEEGPRIQHPEDAIFQGADSAKKLLDALEFVIDDPGSVSIKWDGGVALLFGNRNGEFVITDKYMPNKGVFPNSPEAFKQYDVERGADRSDLYEKIQGIWEGLRAAVGSTDGLFKGDLMWYGELQPNANDQYVFRPTTVEYRVPANSDLGKKIAGKRAGIVVHAFDGQPWDGKTGLSANSDVLILTPKSGVEFKLNNPVRLVAAANKAVNTDGPKAQEFLDGMPKVVRAAIQTYMNKQITGQTKDKIQDWLTTKLSGKQQIAMLDPENGYLLQNADGLNALYNVWNSVNNLKVNIAAQLEKQVTGFEQWSGGKQEGEGFVFNSPAGLVKIVNRSGFGAAHFNK